VWESLGADYWLDYRTLDPDEGHKVFVRQASAAETLEQIDLLSFVDVNEEDVAELIQFSGTDLAGWLVIAVDRPLAELAIEQAEGAGGDAKRIEKANLFMDRADVAMEQGDPSVAIEHLGKAWKHAQQASR
ncbi:MAG: hypothetical protein KJN63_10300, partial [Acidimicrobiia bacterium]|nr:hypothetical protein [Acidimicrobiia bacterium]